VIDDAYRKTEKIKYLNTRISSFSRSGVFW